MIGEQLDKLHLYGYLSTLPPETNYIQFAYYTMYICWEIKPLDLMLSSNNIVTKTMDHVLLTQIDIDYHHKNHWTQRIASTLVLTGIIIIHNFIHDNPHTGRLRW